MLFILLSVLTGLLAYAGGSPSWASVLIGASVGLFTYLAGEGIFGESDYGHYIRTSRVRPPDNPPGKKR